MRISAGPTLARIAEAIRARFGVYTLAGADLLLHRIGWSVQVPARQAAERDEARITAWRAETWPVAKNGGGPGRLADLRGRIGPGVKAAGGPHLGAAWPHSGGESDRRAQLARVPGGVDRRQARTVSPADLPGPPQPRARQGPAQGFTETDYARLLDAAHQQLGGPLVPVWDNLNTHVSRAMAELIAARDWLTVVQLPPYAHELNPVELVWSHLKRSLANLARRSITQLTALVRTRLKITQLTALVRTRLKKMRYRPSLFDGFLASTRLDLTPFSNPHR